MFKHIPVGSIVDIHRGLFALKFFFGNPERLYVMFDDCSPSNIEQLDAVIYGFCHALFEPEDIEYDAEIMHIQAGTGFEEDGEESGVRVTLTSPLPVPDIINLCFFWT